MYPIGKLITEGMQRQNITAIELAERIGYKRISGGVRKINLLISEGKYNTFIIENIPEVLGIEQDVIEEAIQQTKIIKHREKWHWSLRVIPEEPIKLQNFFHAMSVSSQTKIPLQATLKDLSFEQQMAEVSELIRCHYAKKNGTVGGDNKIIGYMFYHSFETPPLRFDVTGKCENADTLNNQIIKEG